MDYKLFTKANEVEIIQARLHQVEREHFINTLECGLAVALGEDANANMFSAATEKFGAATTYLQKILSTYDADPQPDLG